MFSAIMDHFNSSLVQRSPHSDAVDLQKHSSSYQLVLELELDGNIILWVGIGASLSYVCVSQQGGRGWPQ